MRPELLEIQYIEDYLLDKLSKEKREEFENRLKNDPDFLRRVEAQKLIINRVRAISLRQSISVAHKKFIRQSSFPQNLSKPFKIITGFFSLSVLLILFIVLKPAFFDKNKEKISFYSTLKPPIPEADVPFTSQKFDADSGTVLTYPSGTLVIIPPSSLIDEDSNLVSGEVEVKFREFPDIIDIYLAGINMVYAEEGFDTHLESAAMFEIYAFQKNKRVNLASGKQPEIIQASEISGDSYNCYYFEKESELWMQKTRGFYTGPVENQKQGQDLSIRERGLAAFGKPIKPVKQNTLLYSFSIETLPEEFPELQAYTNAKFEVLEEDTVFNISYAEKLWQDVKLKNGPREGTYIVTFSRPSEKVSFLARMVFSEKDYKKAEITYQQKLKEYKAFLEKSTNKGVAKDSAQEKNQHKNQTSGHSYFTKEEIELSRELYRKRIEIIQSKVKIKDLKAILAIKPVFEILLQNKQLIEKQYSSIFGAKETNSRIMRGFLIDGFGLWNIDKPLEKEKLIVKPDFKLHQKPANIQNLTLVLKEVRSLLQFDAQNMEKFGYYPGYGNMLWAIHNKNRLVYYKKFDHLPLQTGSSSFTFEMIEYPDPIETYEQARKIFNDLY